MMWRLTRIASDDADIQAPHAAAVRICRPALELKRTVSHEARPTPDKGAGTLQMPAAASTSLAGSCMAALSSSASSKLPELLALLRATSPPCLARRRCGRCFFWVWRSRHTTQKEGY